jgi:DNA-binding NarL/FixJ family response regulator
MKSVVIVEDDPDIQSLISTIFSMDPRFSVAGLAASAEEALELARTTAPEIIVLDDRLAGEPFRSSRRWLRTPRSSCSQPMPTSRPGLSANRPLTRSCSRPKPASFCLWLSS